MPLTPASLLIPAAIAASPVDAQESDTFLRPEIGLGAQIYHHSSAINEATMTDVCPQLGLATDFSHDWYLRPTLGPRAELCIGELEGNGGSRKGVFLSYGGYAGVCGSIGGSAELCFTGEVTSVPFPCEADEECQLASMNSHGFGLSVGDRDSGTRAGFFAMQVQDTDPDFFPGGTSLVGMRFTTTVGARESKR